MRTFPPLRRVSYEGIPDDGVPMPRLPVRLRFDAGTHPCPQARAQAWREAMSVSADTLFRPEEIEGFAGSLDMHQLGAVLLSEIRATPHAVVRSKGTLTRWAHDHVILDVFAEGGFSGRIGGRPVTVEAGDCVMFDLRGTMRLQFRPMRCLAAVMPRALFDERAGARLAVDGLVFRAGSPEAEVLGAVLTRLVATAPQMPEPVATGFGLGLTSLIGTCVGARGGTARPRGPTVPVRSLARLRRYIDRHAAEADLGPGRLCAQFGLSRTMLYRLFQSSGGVAAAIRHRRAALAVQILRDPAAFPIEQVARDSGFGDERSLRRALRELYGATPSELRVLPDVATRELDGDPRVASLFDEL